MKGKIHRDRYRNVIAAYNNYIKEHLLDGKCIELPYIGNIAITLADYTNKPRPSVTHNCNWKKFRETGIKERYIVSMMVVPSWSRKNVHGTFKNYYTFAPSEVIKREATRRYYNGTATYQLKEEYY
jgi:hypothetical protein